MADETKKRDTSHRPDGQNKKMMIPYMLDILREYTDDDHTLTISEIVELLKRDYGLDIERKSVRRNLETLVDCGYPIGYTEKAEYNGDRLIAEQRAEQRESPVGKRNPVPAHIIKLSRLSAGGRRGDGGEKDLHERIFKALGDRHLASAAHHQHPDAVAAAKDVHAHGDGGDPDPHAVGVADHLPHLAQVLVPEQEEKGHPHQHRRDADPQDLALPVFLFSLRFRSLVRCS